MFGVLLLIYHVSWSSYVGGEKIGQIFSYGAGQPHKNFCPTSLILKCLKAIFLGEITEHRNT